MTGTGIRGPLALTLAIVTIAALPQAGLGGAPVAHIACAPTSDPCSEAGPVNVPAGGLAIQRTDTIPFRAKSVTETLEPSDESVAADVDSMWETMVGGFPNLAGIKNVFVRRVITCVVFAKTVAFVPGSFHGEPADASYELTSVSSGLLSVCLGAVIGAQRASAGHAVDARAGCSAGTVGIPVMIRRTPSGYSLRTVGGTAKPQRVVVSASCANSGTNRLITIRPRARGHTLRSVLGGQLLLGYSNAGTRPAPLTARISFR